MKWQTANYEIFIEALEAGDIATAEAALKDAKDYGKFDTSHMETALKEFTNIEKMQ